MPFQKGRPLLLRKRDAAESMTETDNRLEECYVKDIIRGNPDPSSDASKRFAALRDALDEEREIWKAKVDFYEARAAKLDETADRNKALEAEIHMLKREQNRLEAKLTNVGEVTFDQAFEIEYEHMLLYPAEQRPRRSFEESFQYLLKFRKQFGNFEMTRDYITPDGYRLGRWVKNLRFAYKTLKETGTTNRTLEQAHIDRLLAIGFEFERLEKAKVPWETRLQQLKQYKDRLGTTKVPNAYKHDDNLGGWVDTVRHRYNGKRNYAPLAESQINDLNALGFVWQVRKRKKPPTTQEDADTSPPAKAAAAKTEGDELDETPAS